MGVIWGEVKILFKILCVVYISFRQRKRGKVYFTVSMIYNIEKHLIRNYFTLQATAAVWYQKYERKHGFLIIPLFVKHFKKIQNLYKKMYVVLVCRGALEL